MSFANFQASGFASDDLSRDSTFCFAEGSGRVYLNGLEIEDTTGWPVEAPGFGKGRWYLRIANCQYQSDDLERLERILFDWAVAEGYTIPEPAPARPDYLREEDAKTIARILGGCALSRRRQGLARRVQAE